MRASLIAVLCALLATGCHRVSERTLHDTEGRAVKARCDREGQCTFELVTGTHAPDKDGFAIHTPGMLVGLCDVKGNAGPDSPSDCRPIVCAKDQDCPPAHGLKDGTCINETCREPAASLSVEDSVMLCLAGTGLGTTKPDRLAMGLNCGNPCRVPPVCRQP